MNLNLRKTFKEYLNAKQDSLKFDNVEYGWNKLSKTVSKGGGELKPQLGILVKFFYF